MSGPLSGVRVVEFASIGPGPFCTMLLSDMGADIIRIDRPSGVGGTGPNPVLQRGRPSITLDLKAEADVALAKRMAAAADVVIEGNRPGVMERLGLGPDDLMAANPRLIYARMTGYGQDGPMAKTAGHDINYLAQAGALDAIAKPGEEPRAPLNLLGDFGGGALYLAFGIAAALHERNTSGKGQVVDAAIVEGTASLMGMVAGAYQSGSLKRGYENNVLSGAAPFYRTYECADGRHIAIGSLEPQFYARFIEAMDMQHYADREQRDPAHWPAMSAELEDKFRTRPLADWLALLEPLDACINAVLTLEEATGDAHNASRGVYVEADGFFQPAPAPRFSRTPGALQGKAAAPGEGGQEALIRWGIDS
ncbi:CaiB/BaiF CoA transferase family protein [Henriciella mobilis]|uniref:CoA transferase n=1 Tax=Henriciella mobilis TaxID=2305467 RepID=A0A399RAR9_9PROT|nr:CaiB/BaiF CoA-transferase family protein [Henriciella mobilis]RIJ28550.1 CoA transferase [Henriciella mobilis]